VGGDFLGAMAALNEADSLIGHRSLIRHDADAVAKMIVGLASND
jgi:hypothetical protein